MKLALPGSIKTIVTLIVLLALLPALGLLLYSSYDNGRAAIQAAGKTLPGSVNALARQQTLLVESARMLLSTLAQLPEVGEGRTAACAVLFQNLKLHSPMYEEIRLCDMEGNTLASAAPEPTPLSLPERIQYLAATGSASFTILPRIPGGGTRESGRPIINCLYPVRKGHTVNAMLVVSLHAGIPVTDAPLSTDTPGTHLLLLDRNETPIFAYSSQELSSVKELERPRFSGEHVLQHIRQSPLQRGMLTTDLGQPVAFAKLSLSDAPGEPYFTVIGTITTGELSARMQGILLRNISLLLLSMLFAAGVTWYVCRVALLSPIARILEVANRLKEGVLSARITAPPGVKELALLAESFNQMSEALETRGNDLLNARDLANAASTAKSEFLANMSHEIRTPMNAILGMTYLAKRSNLTPQQEGYIDNIQAQATSLLSIINDILDFSKIEAGKVLLENISFNLRRAIAAVLEQTATAAKAKGIDFTTRFSPELPPNMTGDPLRLVQALANILGNAVKFTAKGGVTFACSPLLVTDGVFLIEFTVQDSGVGMSAEQLARFYPEGEEQERDPSLAGTAGLSLTITRRLLALMQGEISAQSALGAGTLVTAHIPFAPSNSTAETEEDAGEKAEEDAASFLYGVRLLVVDDNPINQQIADEILSAAGARVTLAGNGEEALARLAETPEGEDFQAVLMDLQMPVMDGFEATRRIRKNPRFAGLPVIATTAHTMAEEWNECQAAGMNDYATKPIEVAILFGTLRKWVIQAAL